MDTKLAAEQPPETQAGGDPVAKHDIARVVKAAAGTAHAVLHGQAIKPAPRPSEPHPELVLTERDRARARVQIEAQARALEAYDAAERKILDGGGTQDDAAASITEMTPVTILLQARHYDYLAMRASIFGEVPGAHLERILREFRSYHDDKRPELTAMEAQRNGGAVTRRLA
jgi:hypothetical protein